jgi:thymidylate synthase (FAD)
MNNKIQVLDNIGFVELLDYMGSDLTVVNAARVSFNKESTWQEVDHENNGILAEKDIKLINYLAKHKHWTPFAHPQISLRIKAPIFIRTQLFKHKVGFVENEVS